MGQRKPLRGTWGRTSRRGFLLLLAGECQYIPPLIWLYTRMLMVLHILHLWVPRMLMEGESWNCVGDGCCDTLSGLQVPVAP